LEKRYSSRKHSKAVEAKLLQTAASLRTFFLLVVSAEALKSLDAFLGYRSFARTHQHPDLSHVPADTRCRGDPVASARRKAGVDDFLRWFPGVKREQVLAVLGFAEQSLTVS
jgi:hypothetical protein